MPDLASHFVQCSEMEWEPSQFPGVDLKVLLREPSGLFTALFRWAPGSSLPYHEHVEIEQTYVLEGSLVDDEGEVTAGNYVYRPAGSRHVARAGKNGATIIAFFIKPNKFLGDNERDLVSGS